MIKVHQKSGETLSFDFTNAVDREKWNQMMGDSAFTGNITGMGIHLDRVYHTLPIPQKFNKVSYDAAILVGKNGSKHDGKVVAEILRCEADDIVIKLTVYHTNRLTRCDVVKLGKARYKKPREADDSVMKISDHPSFQKLKELKVKG